MIRKSPRMLAVSSLSAVMLSLLGPAMANAYQWTPHVFPTMGYCENYIRTHGMYRTHICVEGRFGTAHLERIGYSSGFHGGGGADEF